MKKSTILAYKNIIYHKIKYAFIFMITALSSFLIFASLFLTKGMKEGIENTKSKLGADLVVLPYSEEIDEGFAEEVLYSGKPGTFWMESDYEERIKEVPGVEKTAVRLYLSSLSGMSCCDGKIQLIAVKLEDDYLLRAWIRSSSLSENEMIAGSKLGLKAGDTVRYFGREYTVKEVIEKTNTGMDESGFISMDSAKKIMEDLAYAEYFKEAPVNPISMIFVDSLNAKVTSNSIKSIYGKELYVYVPDKKITEYTSSIRLIEKISIVINIFLIIITFLSVYAITYVQTQSRRKEVGSLLAIGLGKKDIYILFLKELCFVTSSSSIIAFLFYELLIGAFGTGIELSLNVPLKGQNTIYELILFIVLFIMNGIFAAISVGCSLDYMYKSEASELLD